MSPSEQTLATFETRVRQLILRFKELKEENEKLQALVANNAKDLQALQAKLAQADNDYNSLKMARMLEITDGDIEGAKSRIARMIREVNKCIRLLSDDQ